MYALLIEHASQEQIDEIDQTLGAPMEGEDGYDPEAERRLLDGLNRSFAGDFDNE